VAQFIGAAEPAEIIWTRGTTDSINLVAHSYGRHFLTAGDEILISAMEHHANIVPWQLVAQAVGAVIKVIPVTEEGEIDLAEYTAMFTEKTRLVCLCHVSNAIGTLNPIKHMTDIAHQHAALVCIDGAQAVAHIPVDVTALDCDFYAFSGHKMYGPTGVGVLYGKRSLLEQMPPYQGGGEMIQKVSFEQTTFNTLPFKFEAGTPNIAGVIGLGAAVNFIQSLDRLAVQQYETHLLQKLHTSLAPIPGCRILSPRESCALVSFTIEGVHHSDLATLLDEKGIAVRSGTHCAMPFFQSRGLDGATRVSIGCYTTQAEIEAFFQALHLILELLS
jgi:SufS family cysteine desulfurase